MSALTARGVLLPWRARLVLVATVLLLTWLGLALLSTRATVDLVLILLPLLLLTFLIGALAGAVLGMVCALAFVLLVNWYVVPPLHTLAIASLESQVALLVFVLAAILAALMTDLIVNARAQAEIRLMQRTLIADVVEGTTAQVALERFAEAFDLDAVSLGRSSSDGGFAAELTVGTRQAQGAPTIDVSVMDSYRVIGYGPERMGVDRGFIESMASAVVRAYEGENLAQAQQDSARLVDLDRSRSALLASVGHDLRTPLAAIRLSTETLQQDSAQLSADDAQELLSTIAESGQRLDGLITNLLDLSRIESGAVISRPVDVDVDQAIVEAIAEVNDASVQFEQTELGARAFCDPALLDRVLVNLLANAVTHRRSASPIECSYGASGDRVVLVIADHGIGIPQELRSDAMKPFQQIGTRADGGSGTGLAIADAFCLAMNGELSLVDTPGGGLTATVRLPRSASS